MPAMKVVIDFNHVLSYETYRGTVITVSLV